MNFLDDIDWTSVAALLLLGVAGVIIWMLWSI